MVLEHLGVGGAPLHLEKHEMTIDINELRMLTQDFKLAGSPMFLQTTQMNELLDRLEAAEKERDTLRIENEALRAEVICIKEVEFPRKAQAVADGWRGKCERLEAKIEAMERQEPVAWYSKRYGFVYMSRQPSQFERGSILYLRNGTPVWRIEGSSRVALLNMASLPHGTVFYALPGAQTQGEEK